MDHIEDFDAEVEEVLPLSEKKKTSKRARIAELAVRLRMKPDKREEYEHELSAKKQEREYGDGEFNWNTLEFNGHEGEYDKSVTGEEDDKEFMGRLFGTLGMRNNYAEPSDDEQNDDEDDEGNEDLDSLMGRIKDLTDQLEAFASENGIDLYNSSIGDTGFDMYKWTFTEGKKAEGKGWSVAIPDGFVKVESKENRIFELIPAGSENLERDSLPIRVLPGEQTKSIVNKWMSHPDAQAGWMAAAARMMAEGMSGVMGGGCHIMASGFGDIGAMVLVQDTGGSSYSYLSIVCTDTVQQMLRVQTAYITDEQKNNLDKSVMAWLETFRFTRKNKAVPEYAPFESPDILNNLKKGTVKDLNDATDAAITEYKASFAGPLQALHYMGENGLLDDYTEEKVKDFLIRSTGVYEYYMKKADTLAEKAIKEKVSYETQKKMYKKLQELSDIAKDKQTITLEGEEIKTEISADVIAIARKWSKKGEEIEKAIEAEKKKEEEKKKRRTEDEKAEYARKTREVLALRESLLKSSIEEKRRKLKAEADRKYEDAVSSGEQFIQTMNKEKEEAQKELGTLGIFAFSRKNDLKTNIKNCDIKIRKRQSVMEAAKEEHTKALSEIEKQIEASKDKEKERIERSNPLPERPASMRLTMDIIYEYMSKNYNVPFTIDDLCEHFKDYGVSTQEMTTLIYRMRENVLVSREVVRGRAYFTAI